MTCLFSSCSFDKKSGIWSGGVEEKRRIAELEKEQKSEIEVVNIYSQKRIFSDNASFYGTGGNYTSLKTLTAAELDTIPDGEPVD